MPARAAQSGTRSRPGDRQLSLSGYDVYRFGGHELDRNNGPRMVAGFLRELLRRYDVPLPPSVTD